MREASGHLARLLLLGLAFLVVSFLARHYHEALMSTVEEGGLLGAAGFVALTALFVVFVIPLDIAFLIPAGAYAFGPLPTALMSIAGWTLGAGVAFALSRRFGQPLVARMVGLEQIRKMERRLPKANAFWGVVALRMFVPVDLLSYAIGLFSSMTWRAYVFATALGVVPFGFYFAYASTLPFWYQLAAVGAALLFGAVAVLRWRRED